MKTPFEIADETDEIGDPKKNRAAIFREFRAQDESRLWPISGRFNVTERAIRHLYKWERETGGYLAGLELTLWLDDEIGRIVNNAA